MNHVYKSLSLMSCFPVALVAANMNYLLLLCLLSPCQHGLWLFCNTIKVKKKKWLI